MARLALVLAVLLAGCSAPATEDPDEVSVRHMLAYAQAEAGRLHPGARLMGVQMIEARDPAAFLAQHRVEFPEAVSIDPATVGGDKAHLALIRMQVEGTGPDARVGDGRAARAAFTFDGDGSLVGVVVAADGRVVFSRVWDVPGKGHGAFSWPVDSDDASGALAAADARFAFMREHGHVAVWDLVKPGGNAEWLVGLLRATPAAGWTTDPRMDGDAADYCELGTARVDAVTGSVLDKGGLYTRAAGKESAQRCDG